jgi:hypothetical protein
MTIQKQVVLDTDKAAHWNSKRDHDASVTGGSFFAVGCG